MTTLVRELTNGNWHEEVLGAEDAVLVDFWAPWCPSCRTLNPTIEKLAAELAGRATVGKLNVDESPEVAERYGIGSIPTLIVFRKGLPVSRHIGALSEARLTQLLETHLVRPEAAVRPLRVLSGISLSR